VAGEDATVSGMAGRYATALFELALEQNALERLKTEFETFEAAVDGNPDLQRLIRSPVFSSDEQAKAIAAVLGELGIGGLAANFIKLVAQKRRLFAIREIVRGFSNMVARHRGEATAEVTVAEPLSNQHLAELKDALKSVTGKDVALSVKVDPAIIGGLVVKLGSRMVDTSLRTKLNALKHAMKEVG
jgi:F-type H+-transporting ATPase subunit delta